MTTLQEALKILAAATAPLDSIAILELAGKGRTRPVITRALAELASAELIKSAGKNARGHGRQPTLWVITEAGRAAAAEIAPGDVEKPGGGVSRKPRKAKRRAKAVHRKKRTGRKPKVQRRNATSRRAGRPSAVHAKSTVRSSVAERWALAADGAFVLLGTEVEIPPEDARRLVAFVRQTPAEGVERFGALVAFINTLDKAEV